MADINRHNDNPEYGWLSMKNFLKRLKVGQSSRGDTIVEVLISMAVLAVVLGAAYATTSRSYHSGLNSQYRDQALLIAQQQVELLKSADLNSNQAPMNTYKSSPTSGFCINPSSPQTALNLSPSKKYCQTPFSSPGQYQLVDKYSPTPNPVFTITVQWQAFSSTTQQVVLYYKVSGSYV